MDKVTGYVTGVNGNLVAATFSGSVRKNEVGYVLVGDDRLKGEVIRVNGDTASMQIYEMTNGIQVGDKVELSGELMSVELGPGLLTQVFDGLQNPLPELAQQCGFFLQRGVYLDPIPNKDWEFTPLVKPGDHVTAGDAVGSVPEGLFTHLIMVPFGLKDEGWRVKSVREKGVYNVRDTVAVLENDNGEEKELTMVFSWPVKQPIRCYEERLRPDETLVTKLRSIDTFLPVAKGVGRLLLWGSILLLVLVIVPGNPIAITENNATRWLGIRGTFLRFQPSELAKMAVVIYFSATISKKREKMQTWSQGIWPYVLILGVIALLMMREPHLSGTILIVCTGIVLMIVGGIKGWLIPLGIGGVGLVGTLYVILVQKGILHYGENRINTWRDPFNAEWYRGDGWQIAQCLIAIGSGGLLGVGLGKGRQKFLYLPEEHNDCIFAVICEELGLVGACVIMLVFALLILRGFWIALHARDRFGALLVVGFMTLTGLQTFLNIAVVTGLVPATGISLPFFSYGGTALLCQLAEMGIVLSVSRQMPAPENG